MKKLPVGIEFFAEVIQKDYYYVDKTNMIKELLNSGSKVTLFTRPRRFGKSLNMDMLKTFFEEGTDTSLFNGLAISEEKELCEKYQGKFPVIALSLKDTLGSTFKDFTESLKIIISESLYPLKKVLLQSCQIDNDDKEIIQNLITNKPGSVADLALTLKVLSRILYQHYKKKVIIIIDEYDVPLDRAYQHGFYNEMADFIRIFFGSALKSNNYLEFAVLTGCLRISKESIFTGLNNFKVMSISDRKFSKYFGFTGEEVKTMLEYYDIEEKYPLFKDWYNGYNFGGTGIYCPWDVINQCEHFKEDKNAIMKSYWINSSGNSIVKDILNNVSANTKEQIEHLISQESIVIDIDTNLAYTDFKNPDRNKRETYLWSILYATGYLTDVKEPKDKSHTLIIPNKEILEIYKKQVLSWFNMQVCYSRQWEQLCSAIENGNTCKIEEILNDFMLKCISIRDTNSRKDMKENFYHGIMIGLFSYNGNWVVKSEYESGSGYPDILIKIAEKKTGCIFEIKYAENGQFIKTCQNALKQIKDRNYKSALEQEGMENIYLYGISFYKKSCKVICIHETP